MTLKEIKDSLTNQLSKSETFKVELKTTTIKEYKHSDLPIYKKNYGSRDYDHVMMPVTADSIFSGYDMEHYSLREKTLEPKNKLSTNQVQISKKDIKKAY